MNKKYLSQTYLKDVSEYEFKMIIKEDCFIGIKKINKIDIPFYLKNGVCLINNNYYVLEILYPDRNYTIRIFLNNEKEDGIVLKSILIFLIKFYRKYISPMKSTKCPYCPTCSEYGLQAVQKYGAIKGGLLAAWRILRCNPFSKGGYDPVP